MTLGTLPAQRLHVLPRLTVLGDEFEVKRMTEQGCSPGVASHNPGFRLGTPVGRSHTPQSAQIEAAQQRLTQIPNADCFVWLGANLSCWPCSLTRP